jgi:hypothetical protein
MQNVKRQNNQVNNKKENDSLKADKAIELMRYNVSKYCYYIIKYRK